LSEQFLLLDAYERRDAYAAAAERFGLPPEVIEKDVWICWVLDVLYREPEPDRHPMAFKGGTSLSKVFDAIFRFSEDVDLTVGISPASFADGEIPTSRNQRDKLRDAVEQELDAYLAGHVVPLLTEALGPAAGHGTHSVDREGSDVVWVEYPSCYEGEIGYIRERVKLEYGARNRIEPNERHTIRPYVAEVLVAADFVLPTAEVDVLSPKRTFWEKATLAHDMCNRGQWDGGADRLSRHWYDLAMLADHQIGTDALADRALLADVVRVKDAFYRRGTSDYDACLSGHLRLLPDQDGLEALAADYAQMIDAGMFSQRPPAIEVLVERLEQLQSEINAESS
jgi:hypothetical protein